MSEASSTSSTKRNLSPDMEDSTELERKRRNTRLASNMCQQCDKMLNPETKIVCSRCEVAFHFACQGIHSSFLIDQIRRLSIQWQCVTCSIQSISYVESVKSEMKALQKEFTQMSERFLEMSKITSAYEQTLQGLSKKIDSIEEKVTNDSSKIELQLNCMQTEKAEHKDLADLRLVVDLMQQEIESLKQKLSSNIPATNGNSDEVLKLGSELTYIRSLERRDNIIIQGVPDLNSENEANLKDLVVRIGKACDQNISQHEIKSAFRLNKLPPSDNETSRSQHRAILVKFSPNSTIKEELLLKYFTLLVHKKPLTVSALGLNGEKRIYIDHHLSKELNMIKTKCLKLKKNGKLQRVSPRYNSIRVQHDGVRTKLDSTQQLDSFLNSRGLATD